MSGFLGSPGAAWLVRIVAITGLSVTAGVAVAADKVVFVTDYGLYGRHAYYFVAPYRLRQGPVSRA
jgi:hypothetical protein